MNKINIDSEKNTFGLTEDSNRYANAVSRNIDTDLLGDVIIAAKNTEKVQESDRRRRENNVIIYGVDEREDTSDEEYIKQLFNVIGVSVKPSNISRLGQVGTSENKRPRPMKLIMKDLTEKGQLMSRLVNLKNAEQKFRQISVRDDYSLDDRKLIKNRADEAAMKNKAENTDEYKVRGNPKTAGAWYELPSEHKCDKKRTAEGRR